MSMDPNEPDVEPAPARARVQVLATRTYIRDLSIERPAIAAYLRNIVPDKQPIALVHAIEVGVTELMARRERASRDRT